MSLSAFTDVLLTLTTRGLPLRADVQAFLSAGYKERHVLEIILAIGVKTLSNYSNHLLHTPLDDMFVSRETPAAAPQVLRTQLEGSAVNLR